MIKHFDTIDDDVLLTHNFHVELCEYTIYTIHGIHTYIMYNL